MRKHLPLIALFIFCCSTKLFAQSCFNVNAGNDTTVSCAKPCFDLKARVPDVKTSEDYKVVAIPYQPYPYINPTGVIFNPTYIDDKFSGVVHLPFTFCFYGNNYTDCVVGTNGLVTFDISNANLFNSWLLNLGTTTMPGRVQPIPYSGGVQGDPDGAYYPKASIMGPYEDIDPEVTQPQPPKRRMEYIVAGAAPCRKFILNFYQIPYFGCPNTIITQQMVLYEGTGIIDIFIENKPLACRAGTNEGRAILGIQNWDRDKAVTVPGRNNTVWTAVNEGWRFVPNGTNSLLSRVELYKNNTLVSIASTANLNNGELEATFPTICQAEDSMSYVVKAFYKKCDNSLALTEGSDTMIVYKKLQAFTQNIINPLCKGDLGTITITSPINPGLEYSIDGGTSWQTSPVFTKPAGTYTIITRAVGVSTCTGSTSVVLTEPASALNVTTNSVNATCVGNDGVITINATGGTPTYAYSINNGATYQASNIFNIGPGNYNNIKIKDNNGCIITSNAVITLNDQMFLNLGIDTTVCFGNSLTLQPQTNAATNNFKWTPAIGLNSDIIKNPTATPVDTVHYTLTATWGVCNRTDDIWLNILRKPIVNAGNDTIICYNTSAALNGFASNLSGSVNYKWTPNILLRTPNAPYTIARPDSSKFYTLTVTDNYGCHFSVSDSVLVQVKPAVIAFAGNDTIAVYGIPHQLSASGGISYLWSPSSSLDNPFIPKPLATLYNDTYFTVVVKNDIGCSNTDDIFIKVYKGPTYYIPNVFTPNGDGLNDLFTPIPVGIKVTNYFNVYNRFGELVFHTTAWLKGWDGTYKGKKAAAGAYTWMIQGIDRDGKIVTMKGSVILMQ